MSKARKGPNDTELVVNATSIGLYPDVDARLNFDVKSLSPSMLVADVIPNPPRTNLVKLELVTEISTLVLVFPYFQTLIFTNRH